MRRWLVIALLLLLGVAATVYVPRFRAMADVGAGYVAKQMCSCIYVGGRAFDACRPDMLPDMDGIQAELLAEGEGVRAWIPLFAERVAHHTEGSGCTLAP